MYLEISSRQCGKTHRMLQDAAKYIRKGYNVMFVCHSQAAMRRIQNWLFSHSVTHPYNGPIVYTTYRSIDMSIRGRQIDRIYFDEFDYADWSVETQKMIFNMVIYTNIAYFVTTAKFIRDLKYMENYRQKKKWDLLVELVRYKGYKFKSYARFNNQFERHTHLNTNQFGAEVRGCWRTHMDGKGPFFRGVELPQIPKQQKLLDLSFLGPIIRVHS